jgi:hypothetical protein
MDDINPYAPPTSAELEEGLRFDFDDIAWRDGKLLMVRKDAILPDRCVKCNEPAEGYQFKRSLTWANPWYAVLIVVSPLLYILVYLILSKKGKVTAGVCRLHRKKRRTAILSGWLTALAGIGSFFFAAVVPNDMAAYPVIGGFLLLLTGLLGGVFGSRIFVPQRIDKHFIWLNKLSPAYLLTFPDSKAERGPFRAI